ncbi:MAG: sigma-70 family RNA polymerase sigma factor [Candidatus Aminicenantes bacterium]|nr:sigma-70 family RNA polymerase sigma factor [Candidatus Aminicenantes bacterium]
METSQSLFWDYLAPLKPKLYNYILKSLNFSPDADDVFQETVLHGLQYFRSFRRDEIFGAWIFGIAHNEIRTHFKKRRRTESLPEPDKIAASAAGSPGGAVGEVYRYAAQLKPRERDIFFLFYESGFSIAEIADLAKLKEGHIKLILFQARTALKTIMGVTHE